MTGRGFRQASYDEPLLCEMGSRGEGQQQPPDDVPVALRRDHLPLPSPSELEVVRHFTRLSQMNFGIDTGMYPLGSCTMKYNPKVNDLLASLPGFADLHPCQSEETVQGALKLVHGLERLLCEITGMDAVTLQPTAGAHGEFVGLLLIKAYHRDHGGRKRKAVVVPDTAHGTNPASAAMAGYEVVEVPSKEGCVDLDALRSAVGPETAAFMLTNPNTLGIFESEVGEIARIVHGAGALLYYDGANMNANLGIVRPGDMDFDVVHLNLHKTFSTPHGGGGPGAAAVGVKKALEPYLPVPVVVFDGKRYRMNHRRRKSIGKVSRFYGNFANLVRAYSYIRLFGADGLRRSAEIAVLNSNYLRAKLTAGGYPMPYRALRKHEFVLSGAPLREKGSRTLDAAKHLLDWGFHAPTIYFPHLVEEAIMIEPTESEPKEELDRFAEALLHMLKEDAAKLAQAPTRTAAARVDDAKAAREPVLSWRDIPEKR